MATGNYAEEAWLKEKNKIEDEEEDQDLADSIEGANRFVDDLLAIHAGTTPLTGDQLLSATGVANAEAMSEYKLAKRDIDVSKEWRYRRDEKVKALIALLQSDPTTNTQTQGVAVSSSYRSEPLKSRSS